MEKTHSEAFLTTAGSLWLQTTALPLSLASTNAWQCLCCFQMHRGLARTTFPPLVPAIKVVFQVLVQRCIIDILDPTQKSFGLI